VTVWKFVLAVTDSQEIAVPIGAEPLYVAEQAGDLCMWARVDPKNPHSLQTFYVTGTGYPVPTGTAYIGSVQMPPFVWHVWEVDS
jgi:tagatose-1,6-bisphosphate aldolase non-catalytic subunit AgaZ/GatZ